MSRNGVLQALAALTAAYSKEMADPTIRLYVNGLADLDDSALAGAVEELIVHNKFFPTIAEVREVAVFRTVPGGRPPAAEIAWLELLDKASTVGSVDQQLPDCLRCDNTRWIARTDDEGHERLSHCSCMGHAVQHPRPAFSHSMIGVAIDLVGGYNKLCRASEREREATKRAFVKSYNKVILDAVSKSIYLDDPRRKELRS